MVDLRQERLGFVAGGNSLAFFISCGIAGSPVSAGFETCTFCLMPASRDAVYHTRKSAGEWKPSIGDATARWLPAAWEA